MRYLGGKSRLARPLCDAIEADSPGYRTLWEPFCGGLGFTREASKRWDVIATDVNPSLIALYRAVAAGWDPPDTVTEDDYRAARSLPDDDPLKAFIGFGCSFGGKWFGGFARDKQGTNYAARSLVSLNKDLERADRIHFLQCDFLSIEPGPIDEIVYADPPYVGTTGYDAVTGFDPARFWERCRAWASYGVPVYVSEFTVPDGCEVVWSRERKQGLRKAGDNTSIEYLVKVNA